MKNSIPSVAVVGATGAVGVEMLAVLEQRKFRHGPMENIEKRAVCSIEVEFGGVFIGLSQFG